MQNDPGGTRLENVDRAIQVMQARRTRVLWYVASGVVALLLALVTRWVFQQTGLYILLFSGLGFVFLVAGGAGPTAVATVGALVLAHLLPPIGSMWPSVDSDRYRLYGNAVLMTIASVLAGLYRRSRLAALQRLARLELATREQQEVLESSTEAMLLTDASLRVTYVNTQLELLFGVAREDAMGRDVRDFLAPESLTERPLQVEALHTGETIRSERAAFRADGTRIDLDISARFISGHRLLAVIRDATARKALADQQRAERDLLNGILSTSVAGVGVVDMTGAIVFANQRAVELLGLTKADPLAVAYDPVTFRQYTLQGERLPAEEQPYWRVVRDKAPVYDAQLVLGWSDGRRMIAAVNGAPLFTADGVVQGVVLAVNDITTSVSTAHALRQSQKMESVGRLAGSVAHDFNNLLTVILGESELLAPIVTPGGEVAHAMANIRAAAESGSALTKQLLGFSRRQAVSVGLIDVNTLVQRVPTLVNRLLGVNVQLELALMASPPMVRVDAAQFDQVLINLMVNARDAMPTGGHITLQTRGIAADTPERLRYPALAAGDLVEISVQDVGGGMTDAVQQRAFEPFFTTKGPTSGTGLGLATTYGIVTQLGGTLLIDSVLGVGTTMRILLPTTSADAAAATIPVPEARPTSVRGNEMVLVVDDNAAVRAVTASLLRRQGYRVVDVSDGDAALHALRARPGQIGVVVTDVHMPGSSGIALAEVIWQEDPAQRVLFVTGHEDGMERSLALTRSGVGVLPKPFDTGALAQQVRQLLDAPTAPPAVTLNPLATQ
ncbi:MAG: PAS domain S-box protein [Gemmatimonadaceae bacterium]